MVAVQKFGGCHNVPLPIELALARPPSRPIQYYQIGELTVAYRLADSGGVCASSINLQQTGLAPALRAQVGRVRVATLQHCHNKTRSTASASRLATSAAGLTSRLLSLA